MGTLDAIVGGSNSPSAIMNHTARYHTTHTIYICAGGRKENFSRRGSRGNDGVRMGESRDGQTFTK